MSLPWAAKITNVRENLKIAISNVCAAGCWMFFHVQVILWRKDMLEACSIHRPVFLSGTGSPQ